MGYSMDIKSLLLLVLVVFFILLVAFIKFDWILISFKFSIATFVLLLLGIGSFLLGAGAVLPRGGRSGMSTFAISIMFFALSFFSALSIKFNF